MSPMVGEASVSNKRLVKKDDHDDDHGDPAGRGGTTTMPYEENQVLELEEVASGLLFPEGPLALPDGSVLVVEMCGGRITRILPGGGTDVVADTGGGPNGLALGPDGAVYVCNNG